MTHLRKNLGKDAEDFIAALSLPPKRAVRVNTLKADPKEITAVLKLETPSDYCPDAYICENEHLGGTHPYHAAGLLYFGEPSAMLAIEAARPYLTELLESSEYPLVLDACAAPGGKSGAVAALMKGKGLLVSNEIVSARAAVLSGNLERLGVRNAMITSSPTENLASAMSGIFDAVIADVPCSGEGMLRKEESAWDNMNEKVMISCARRQSEIVENAAKCVKEGGLLIYSTCTLNTTENEGVLAPLLERGEFRAKECPHLKRVRTSERFFAYRAFPQDGGGEGHFVCVLEKTRGERKKTNFSSPFDGKYKNAADLEKLLGSLSRSPLFYTPYRFKDSVVLCPPLPSAKGIYLVRAGVKAAVCSGSSLVPDHCFAASVLKDEALIALDIRCEVGTDDKRRQGAALFAKYTHGEQIESPGEKLGWGLVCTDGYPLGLVKSSGGYLKNHYPKALRT